MELFLAGIQRLDATIGAVLRGHKSSWQDAMTETRWLAAQDPVLMLEVLGQAFLKRQADQEILRKLLLFAGACCREVWRIMPAKGRAAVELGEASVGRRITDGELERANREPLSSRPLVLS